MSLNDTARDWVKSVISNHVGSNIRHYEWTNYLGELRHNVLGAVAYLLPIEGTVVDANEQFTLVKIGANKFRVILTTLLSEPVAIGARIAVKFYNLRRFDGSLADGSEDPAIDGIRRVALSGAETLFPVKWEGRYLGVAERFEDGYREIQNPYLRDLITQMESIPVNGGMRRIVNVLVDAGAKDLDFVDPPQEKSADTPPAVLATVATKKFVGRVEILYDRASDTYGLRFTPAGEGVPHEVRDVHFDELGEVLEAAVDDQTWRQAKVTVLRAARKPRLAAAASV